MIKLKINELIPTQHVLNELIEVNEQPFKANAKILIYKISNEIDFIRKSALSKEDIEIISDEEVTFGAKIPAPVNFPAEFTFILEKICNELPNNETQSKAIIEKINKKKK